MTGDAAARPAGALRQPVVWVALALPLAVLVAGVQLIRTAAGPGSTDTVSDRVQRVAQIQTAEFAADAAAGAANMSATLVADAASIRIDVAARAPITAAALELRLSHPTDARLDRAMTLVAHDGAWSGPPLDLAAHDWIVELVPTDAGWRLRGRWSRGASTVRLAPSVTTR